ncbi:hypothetical protein BD626DRAFT_506056 [Schizophyllum amplum]|uniref:Uncharacterized protein n=1 Tax=Schizophyllum amplum TaxID=97359 RepID=A0A550C5A9_9AGAR|nr:hypothetical protein BD626DRAFT_506056 [Auriculariopsis ampla]
MRGRELHVGSRQPPSLAAHFARPAPREEEPEEPVVIDTFSPRPLETFSARPTAFDPSPTSSSSSRSTAESINTRESFTAHATAVLDSFFATRSRVVRVNHLATQGNHTPGGDLPALSVLFGANGTVASSQGVHGVVPNSSGQAVSSPQSLWTRDEQGAHRGAWAVFRTHEEADIRRGR